MRSPSLLRLAAAGLCLSTPFATWWAVGPLSEDVRGHEPDYLVTPPDIPSGVETGVGLAALLVAVASVGILGWAAWRHQLDRGWIRVLVPLLVAGVILGAGGRVVTAASIGANIGGAVILMYGGPLVALLVVAALAAARRRR